MEAIERGWIPKGPLTSNPGVESACIREDTGEYHCVLKRGELDATILGALGYIYNVEGVLDTEEANATLSLSGPELYDAASVVISDFYDEYYSEGATCDFGGIAMLVEQNYTATESELRHFTDDDFYGYVREESGPPLWKLVAGGFLIAFLAGMSGFIVAMRTNPRFNEKIRKSTVLRPIVQVGSKSQLFRSSLNLPMLEDYETLQEIDRQHQAGR